MADIIAAIIIWASILLLLLILLVCITCSLCYTFKRLKYKNDKIVLREQVLPIMATAVPIGEPIIVDNYEPQLIQTQQDSQLRAKEQKIREQPVYEVSPKLVKRKFYDFDGDEVVQEYVQSMPRIHRDVLKIDFKLFKKFYFIF